MSFIFRIICLIFFYKDWCNLYKRVNKLNIIFNKFECVPNELKYMLILGEDHRNKYHKGYDIIAIIRVIWIYISEGKRQGASTIEQQFIRTVIVNYDKTLLRKFKEILLASMLNKYFNKNTIMKLYLHIGYFGWNMHGYINACKKLGFNYKNLSLEESAIIISSLKYPIPRKFSDNHSKKIERRKKHLLNLYNVHRLKGIYGKSI